MKSWVLILAAIAILLLVWGVRERFNPATERPTKTDASLRRVVESNAGTTKPVVVDGYIEAIQVFYDTKYLPTKKTPEAAVVRDFVDKQTMKPEMAKDKLMRILEYVFLSTTSPMPRGDVTSRGGAVDTSRTSGTTTGGTTGSTQGPNSGGGGDRRKQVFGPLFTSQGEGGVTGVDSSKTNKYPQLLGGDGGKASTRIDGGGIVNPSGSGVTLPSLNSLGLNENSNMFPFSRQPGDMDLIPDPYRVSQQFSAASYSSKTEPVPFLTDFSAFQT